MPDGLAARFALLLVVALLGANIIALVIVGMERQAFDRRVIEQREIERLAGLVPALENVGIHTQRNLARRASTRFAKLRVAQAPLITGTAPIPRAQGLADRLEDALDGRQVHVGVISTQSVKRDDAPRASRWRPILVLSIALRSGDDTTRWLNVTTTSQSPREDAMDGSAFLVVLVSSLLGVLVVGLYFVKRLTRPLTQLAEAARAAGYGDRSARVPETGAREMREAAAAFNAMQVEIQNFDAERMRTLAAVGHDLRTPMTSLRIRTEMIDDPEQRDAMIRTLDEMGVMADGLVSFARDSRESEPSAEIDLVELLERLCAEKGVALVTPETATLFGRPVALSRAIGNVIENAVRYAEDVHVSLTSGGADLVIEISDSGPGIAPDILDSVFEPFHRGEKSRNLETGGSGLGLSIARRIVQSHGGTIALENREPRGLVARITLPSRSR